MGLEPTNGGTTTRCLNLLATLATCLLQFNIITLCLSSLQTDESSDQTWEATG